MSTMNQSQYAQHSGVDRKTIGRWIKAGRFIVMDGDLIDVEASDAALKKNRAYIVIAPHVALSHSKPEDGALSISMGIYAMDFGIDFGNPEP